jgi:hypothetical protein
MNWLDWLFGRRTLSPFSSPNSQLAAKYSSLLHLGNEPAVLEEILHRGTLISHLRYHHYQIPKSDGGKRNIAEPDRNLKRIQQLILKWHLDHQEPHFAATAYRKGLCIADHVRPHLGAEWIVTADIQDFFPRTRKHRIEAWWSDQLGFLPGKLFTLLTTDNEGLPQGAPTSPALSNLVNFPLDETLTRRAALAGADYSRYCDDMVFSWRVGEPPSDFAAGVRSALSEFGYDPHPSKGWRVFQREEEPTVTGLVLTQESGVRLPARIQKVMRELARSKEPRDVWRLLGYRSYQKMIAKALKQPVRQPQKAMQPQFLPVPVKIGERTSPTFVDDLPF